MDEDYWCDFVAGWIGGCAGLLVGQPMDTIKVRQQALTKVSSKTSIINIFKYEGIRGYYKGLSFPLLAAGTLNSLFFGVYGNSIRWLSGDKDKPSTSNVYIAGCAGGVAQLIVACPVDLVKIKMQLQLGASKEVWGKFMETNYKGPISCFRKLYKNGGISSCYTGITTMFLRDVIASGFYMVVYSWMTDFNPCPSTISILWAGGMAGVISWASILPLDVVKSRIQADCPINPQYKNLWDCLVKSYKAEGLQVFTRGFWMMSLRAFPTNSAIFFGYVTSLDLLRSISSQG
ncbi:solute carrier family 25 member 48-like isoform X2 [Homarus americanus]|uniref:solute carrier family 25 member 48-like isoform X2 n=1 Tax=Homarus americanus TaxID=6706 RepID=UPI001C48BF1C|nr:solute carrier family 25 member 48-like isoform X2 [Homarus americanus]